MSLEFLVALPLNDSISAIHLAVRAIRHRMNVENLPTIPVERPEICGLAVRILSESHATGASVERLDDEQAKQWINELTASAVSLTSDAMRTDPEFGKKLLEEMRESQARLMMPQHQRSAGQIKPVKTIVKTETKVSAEQLAAMPAAKQHHRMTAGSRLAGKKLHGMTAGKDLTAEQLVAMAAAKRLHRMVAGKPLYGMIARKDLTAEQLVAMAAAKRLLEMTARKQRYGMMAGKYLTAKQTPEKTAAEHLLKMAAKSRLTAKVLLEMAAGSHLTARQLAKKATGSHLTARQLAKKATGTRSAWWKLAKKGAASD